MTEFFRIPRAWPGETCFILGRGPSLRGFDASVLRGAGRVVVINTMFRAAPWADALYFCDRTFWQDYGAEIRQVFTGRYLLSVGAAASGVGHLRNSGPKGLETDDPAAVRHGTNSGYQAINAAYHFGVKRIVLLGYDMHVDGGAHCDNDLPDRGKTLDQFARQLRDNMLPRFSCLVEPLAKAGVEVINATPGSALKCWPYRPLAEILAERVAA